MNAEQYPEVFDEVVGDTVMGKLNFLRQKRYMLRYGDTHQLKYSCMLRIMGKLAQLYQNGIDEGLSLGHGAIGGQIGCTCWVDELVGVSIVWDL